MVTNVGVSHLQSAMPEVNRCLGSLFCVSYVAWLMSKSNTEGLHRIFKEPRYYRGLVVVV